MSFSRWWAPLLLTLAGAALRWHRLAEVRLDTDYAFPLSQAIAWLEAGRWPVLGQTTSVFWANPAGMSYVVAAPWAVFGSAWGVAFWVAGLNLAAVPLTYQLTRRLAGERAALAAALLAATNPWTVHYSQGTWVQGLLPFWTALTLTCLVWALTSHRPRGRWLAAALAAAAGLTQMYLLAFLNLAPLTAALVGHWRRLDRRGLALGLAVLMLATLGYGAQIALDWSAQSEKLSRLTDASQPLRLQPDAWQHALRLVTGADYTTVYGNDGSAGWGARQALGQALSAVLTAATVLGLGWAVRVIARRGPLAGVWAVVLAWAAAPIVALTLTRHPVHIIYLTLTLPAGFVLAAPALAWVWRWRTLGVAAALGLTATTWWARAAAADQLASQPQGPSLSVSTVGVADGLRGPLAAEIARLGVAEVYTPMDEAALTVRAGRPLRAVTWADPPARVIFQTGRPALYLRSAADALEVAPLAERVLAWPLPGGEHAYLEVIPARTRAEVDQLPQVAVGWPTAEGYTLLGYDLAPGAQWLDVYWAIDALPEDRADWLFAPFANLYDAAGRQTANVSGPGLPGAYYRADDVVVFRLPLPPLPAGEYRLALSLFDGVNGNRTATFLPPAGPPALAYETTLILPGPPLP